MSYTLNHQTPVTGSISWSGVHIVFDGSDNAIVDGSTSDTYVYWLSASPTQLFSSNDYPTLGEDDAIVFINRRGVGVSVLDSSTTDGGLVVPGTITSAAIAAGAITADHISAESIESKHIASEAVEAEHIAANAITSDKILVNSIEATHIVAEAIEADHLSANSVTTKAIAAGAVTAVEIAAGTIVSQNIAADAIGSREIAAGAVTASQIAAGTITASQIAAGTITSDNIAAGAIGAAELAIGASKFDSLRACSYGNKMTVKTWGVWLNGVSIGNQTGNGRGHTLCVFDRSTHALLSKTSYDTYANPADALGTALAALDSSVIAVITTSDAMRFDSTGDTARAQLKRCGASNIIDNIVGQSWYAYTLIGYPGIGEGNGIEQVKTDAATEVAADITAFLVDRNIVGTNNSLSQLAPLGTTYIKDGAITTSKITAGAITANEIAANAITTAKIAAGAITAAQIATDTITAAQVAAGAIGATEIAANSILASHLTIADFENLAANGDFAQGPLNWSSAATASVVTDAVNAYSTNKNVLTLSPTSVQVWLGNSNKFSCKPGDKLYFEWAGKVSAVLTGSALANIHFNDKNGNWVASYDTGKLTNQTTYAVFSGEVTVPADAVNGLVAVTYNNSVGTAYIGYVMLRRKSDGKLIVDGSITTAKLAAGAVTANEIAANTITSSKIVAGAIGATEIAANAVTAKHLVVGDYSNLAIDPNGDSGVSLFSSGTVVTTPEGAAYQCPDSVQDILALPFIPVEPGDQYNFSADMAWVSGGVAPSAIGFAGYNAAGVVVDWYAGAITSDTSAGWKSVSGNITIPANVAKVRIWWQRNGNGSACGVWNMRNVVIKKRLGGSLIIDGEITAAKIAAGTITTVQIAADTITSANIAAGAIGASEIAAGAVTANAIAAGTITATQIAAGTITSANIAAGTIGADRLAANSITTAQMAIGDFTNLAANGDFSMGEASWSHPASMSVISDTANAYPGLSKVLVANPTAGVTWLENTSHFTCVAGEKFYLEWAGKCASTITGAPYVCVRFNDKDGNQVGVPSVGQLTSQTSYTVFNGEITAPANAVSAYVQFDADNTSGTVYVGYILLRRKLTGNLIVDGSITTAKLAANSVTAANIAAGTITATQIATDTITAANIAAGAIGASEIATGAITAGKVAAGVITATELAADSVTSAKILAGAVTATEVATGAITADKILAGAVTADKLTIGTTKFDNVRIKSYGNSMADKTAGVWLNNVSQGVVSRGTTLWVFNKTTHAKVSVTTYDTHDAIANCDALATALAALTETSVIFITTADACSFNSTGDALRTQLKRCGASTLVDGLTTTGARYAYALIGYPTLGEGNGLEIGKGIEASETPCELSTLWMDDTLVGLSGSVSPLAPLSSTYIKDGSILTAKIAAGAVTANEIAADAITAAKIAAGTITGDKIAAGAITAEKIAAGTITADKIAAGAIKASSIVLGDFTNIVVDPNGDAGVSIFDNSVYIADVGNGNFAYRCVAGVRDSFSQQSFSVVAGEQYWFHAYMNWDSGAQTASTLGFVGYTSTGAVVNWYGACSTSDYSSGWKSVSGTITIPSGVERVKIWWQRNGWDVSTCGVWSMRNVQIRKKISGGDLLVAGSITGDKIAANQSLTSPIINAGTGSFSGALTATSGTFDNVTINSSCTFKGTVNGDQINNGVIGAINRGTNTYVPPNSTVLLASINVSPKAYSFSIYIMASKFWWSSGAPGRLYMTITGASSYSFPGVGLGDDATNVSERTFNGNIIVPANSSFKLSIYAHNVSGTGYNGVGNINAIATRGSDNVIY